MFIKLTGYPNDLSVCVQADQIVFFGNHPKGYTHIQITNMENGLRVKETPEQIMEMIKNA